MTIEESSIFVGEKRIWMAGLKEKYPVIVTCTHIEGSVRADKSGITTKADVVSCSYRDHFGEQKVWFHSTNWREMQLANNNPIKEEEDDSL